ncbi:glycosyltransferase family 1 protein [Winogradskyella sp. SYSU M77433]|uniref:glycosyltransferase family 4 protein n=1 Tax=Winogradskyella sp. SYSU M77433 TaxID=3042722 RepID=UPI002480F68F|nr:glycosyltransferase family 1 protein [Winogradskyella sp. SYSU M77433]MDH7911509.1 glycosyltransferase family 1 protein [Winogradskyella sp. SYSU M77433]
MKLKLGLFFRKSQAGFYSIETVFNTIQPYLEKKIEVERLELPQSKISFKSIVENLKFVRNNRKEVNHITGHVNYIAITSGRNTVLTIHDMISALQGNPIKRFFMLALWFWLPVLFVKKITVISNYTKDEVYKYIPFVKSKVVVINNPIGAGYVNSPKKFNTNRPNILCVGTKENKNLKRIFKALSGIQCSLTIIGKLKNDQKKILSEYKLEYFNYVDISDYEIVELYKECDLLCFASLYEGFGMPIIEAQTIGRPVVTSNVGAMSEIANNSASLVDPYNCDSIRKGILKVINNESYRRDLIKKGYDNSKRFSANIIAQKYIEIYKNIING